MSKLNGATIDVGYKILEDGRLLLAVPKEQQPILLNILNRALNCWPECPPEWKHLADILMHGEPLVDYYSQEASSRMRHTNKEEFIRCDDCLKVVDGCDYPDCQKHN